MCPEVYGARSVSNTSQFEIGSVCVVAWFRRRCSALQTTSQRCSEQGQRCCWLGLIIILFVYTSVCISCVVN